MTEGVAELPEPLRHELKEPMGPIYTDAGELLAAAGEPVVTVGDMVTYHLLGAGRVPDVALVDDRTERTAVDDDVRESITGFDREVTVRNPPATLTADLVAALVDALDRAAEASTLIVVDGEEDLATLPALIAAPAGASVVYGQPQEGMVLVSVDSSANQRARELVSQMDGDAGGLLSILEAGA